MDGEAAMTVATRDGEVSSTSRRRWWIAVAISPVVAAVVTYAVMVVYAIWRELFVEQERWEERPTGGWTLVAEPGTVLTYPDRVVGWMWVLVVGVVAGFAVALIAGVRAWPAMLLVGAAGSAAVMVSMAYGAPWTGWRSSWWLQVLIVAAATVLGLWAARSLGPPKPGTRRLELVVLLGIPVAVAASLLVSGIVGVDLLGPVGDALAWAVATALAGLLAGLVLAWVAGAERRRWWIVALASALVPAVVVLAGVSPAWPMVHLVMVAAALVAVLMLRRLDANPDGQTELTRTLS
jgi:hypothetical protein